MTPQGAGRRLKKSLLSIDNKMIKWYNNLIKRKEVKNMTVRRMVTIIEEKFGADSKNAMYMRILAKGYYLKHGVTFEECKNFYQLLLKK